MQIIALVANLSKEANRVDPDQTATIGAARSGSTVFAVKHEKLLKHLSKREKQTTFVAFGAPRVKPRRCVQVNYQCIY